MWHPISQTPQFAIGVELYYAKAVFRDQHGNIAPELPPYRDERRALGYWDGETWRFNGTGHEVFEVDDTPDEFLPTHWRALDLPPRSGDGEAAP